MDKDSVDTLEVVFVWADYLLFGEMLLQRPVQTGGLSDILSLSDTQYMKDMAAQRFDQITLTLQQLPREMLLIIRLISLIYNAMLTNKLAIISQYFMWGNYASAYTKSSGTVFVYMPCIVFSI